MFVANRVVEILDLTTVDRQLTNGTTYQQPTTRRTRAHAVCRRTPFDSSWLKGSKFLMTPDWPFQPSEEIWKTKLKNFVSNEVNTEPVYQETTANSASVSCNVLTLEWQKYSTYEKHLRIVTHILRSSPKFSSNRTKTGGITDPLELESAQQNFFSWYSPNRSRTKLKICSILVH